MHPSTKWENLNVAYENYLDYISKKPSRLSPSYVDLLYVSNFKGGNSSIIDEFEQVDTRLLPYAEILHKIETTFRVTELRNLNKAELKAFVKFAADFVGLPYQSNTQIRGFKGSYASALLSAHFPALAPILDRYVLNATSVKGVTTKQSEGKRIQHEYSLIIRRIHKLARQKKYEHKTLREIDKALFVSGASG